MHVLIPLRHPLIGVIVRVVQSVVDGVRVLAVPAEEAWVAEAGEVAVVDNS